VEVRWGVQYGEMSHPYPKGPCARLESIKEGRWKWLKPRPVRIPVSSFGERSRKDRCNYWFAVPDGLALQGLFVPPTPSEPSGRVYVVTVPLEEAIGSGFTPQLPMPEGGLAEIHDRWPRLVSLKDSLIR